MLFFMNDNSAHGFGTLVEERGQGRGGGFNSKGKSAAIRKLPVL